MFQRLCFVAAIRFHSLNGGQLFREQATNCFRNNSYESKVFIRFFFIIFIQRIICFVTILSSARFHTLRL